MVSDRASYRHSISALEFLVIPPCPQDRPKAFLERSREYGFLEQTPLIETMAADFPAEDHLFRALAWTF